MPTGISALGKILIGVESPAGDTDAPTTHWRGTGALKDTREVVFPPEKVGKLGGTTRSYIPRTGGEVVLDGDATFEQICYLFNAGIYGTTPTTDAGSGKIWTWTVQTESTNSVQTTDLNTLVVEGGDNITVETMHYGFVRELTLSGKQGEAVMVSALLEGRAPADSSSFTAIGDTDLDNTAETILTSKGKMYIDPSTDPAGTTQKTDTIIDWSLKFTTGWMARPAKDGRLDFADIKRVSDEIVLDVTFEHNTVATAEKSAWRNETGRVIRLQFDGSALSSTSANWDAKALRIDLYGKWQTFGAEGLEEVDGDNVYRGTFRAAWDAGADNKAAFTVVNNLGALP